MQAYYNKGLQNVYKGIVSPIQNGIRFKSGILITALGVQAALDANPQNGIIKGDICNRYKKLVREEHINGKASLHDTLAFKHAIFNPARYIGMGKGTSLTTAPFRSCEGVQQGAIKIIWDFTMF